MRGLVIALRIASLLAFAGPMLLGVGRRGEMVLHADRERQGRIPVAANFGAFILFFIALAVFSGSSEAPRAVLMALSGCSLAVAGVAVVLRSRAELGSAWSLVPRADRARGLVTTGPYRFVRHPIYLGLILVALGQSLAFGNRAALLVVVLAVVPTFVWRARAEEELLGGTFGARYARYRERTRMVVPFIL